MPYTTPATGTAITVSYATANIRDQVVTPFASATARDSAITSPLQGMVEHLNDVNRLTKYSGSAWEQLNTSYGLISKQTLGSPVSSVTFSSIPQTYDHLVLYMMAKSSDVANTIVDAKVRVNGDTGSNYSSINQYVNQNTSTSSAASANTATSANMFVVPGSNVNAAVYGGGYITFLGYTSSVSAAKQMMGPSITGDYGIVGVGVQRWGTWCPQTFTPASITSITVLATSGNFTTNSIFSLYGVSAP